MSDNSFWKSIINCEIIDTVDSNCIFVLRENRDIF